MDIYQWRKIKNPTMIDYVQFIVLLLKLPEKNL